MVKNKETFTSEDLCARYGCTLRTIHHMERKKGFPLGAIYSKGYVWSVAKVIAWEKIHMPHLHVDAVVDEDPEQAAEWEKRSRRRALDREDGGEEEQKPQRPQKAKRPPSRKK